MDDLRHIIKLLEEQGKKISNIEMILESKQTKAPESVGKRVSSKPKKDEKYSGLTKSIFDLIDDSFFNKPKEIKEIENRLKANAVFYPITSYSRPLLRLIKNKHLRRTKENNKWKYVKY